MPVSRQIGCVIFVTYEWDFKYTGRQLSFNHVVVAACRKGFCQAPRQAQVILAGEVSTSRAECSCEIRSDTSYTWGKRVSLCKLLFVRKKSPYTFLLFFSCQKITVLFLQRTVFTYLYSCSHLKSSCHKSIACLVCYLNILHWLIASKGRHRSYKTPSWLC